MKKLFTILLFLVSLTGFSQDETHDFITYDTSWSFYGQTQRARISRPANMFTANHPDTASRALFAFIPGQGQMGTNYGTLDDYGPHYQMAFNGWDGSVTLADGRKRYPVIISIISTNTYFSAGEAYYSLNMILNKFHIKRNAVHLSGLSQGTFAWSSMILFEVTPGDEAGKKLATSMTLMQGASNEVHPSGTTRPDSVWGTWASKYNGKLFQLQGTRDGVDGTRVGTAMNLAVPGSAYRSYEKIGGGGHCCWNSMFDVNQHDWRCIPTVTNTSVIATGSVPNMMGTYKGGDNVWQWAYRQGDTSFVGTSTVPVYVSAVFPCEYTTGYIKSDSSFWTTFNSVLTKYSFSGKKIVGGTGLFNFYNLIDSEGHVWETNITNTSTSRILLDTLGNDFDSVYAVDGYASVQTLKSVAVALRKSDSSMWYYYNDNYNIMGGGYITKPIKIGPSGVKFKQVQLGKNIVALATNGDVYQMVPGNSTFVKQTLPAGWIGLKISSGNYDARFVIAKRPGGSDTCGRLLAWGADFGYWSGTVGYSSPTEITSFIGGITGVKEINMSTNTMHLIDSTGHLYAAGDNYQAELGNGDEIVNKHEYGTKYGGQFTKNQNVVPFQAIAPSARFKSMPHQNFLYFGFHAIDVDNVIWFTGRNKSDISGQGILADNEADYSNACDVVTLTKVSPFDSTLKVVHFTREALSAGSNQVLTGVTTATLTAVGRAAALVRVSNGDTLNYRIASWSWTKLSGPACSITNQNTRIASLAGLTAGNTYTFQVTMTDNNGGTTKATTSVSVNAPAAPINSIQKRKGARFYFIQKP